MQPRFTKLLSVTRRRPTRPCPAFGIAARGLPLSRAVHGQAHAKPPSLVELTLAGVMTALRRPPDWDEAKRALGEASFLDQLLQFDRGALSDALLKSLARYTGNPDFTPEVHASCSCCACSLARTAGRHGEAAITKCRLWSACAEEREACTCGCAQSACMAALRATSRLVAPAWPAPRQRWPPRKLPCLLPRQRLRGRSRPSLPCR